MSREIFLRFDCRAHGRDVDFEHCLRGAEHFGGSLGGATGRILRPGRGRHLQQRKSLKTMAGFGSGSGFPERLPAPGAADLWLIGLAG